VWRTVDLTLRFIYVMIAPMLLTVVALVMPVTGIVVTALLATVIAIFGGDHWRERVGKIRFVGRVLAKFGALGEYYCEFPPRPLVYYLLYPVLIPYWLINRRARREFLLFRRINVLAIGIVVVGGTIDYFKNWRGDIPFSNFAGATIGLLLLQIIALSIFVMPIVTTVIILHQRHHKRLLIALLVGSTAMAGIGASRVLRHRPVSTEALTRLRERTKFKPAESRKALEHALVAINRSFHEHAGDLVLAMERGREALEELYRPDEANAFRLLGDDHMLVLFELSKWKSPIWLGLDAHGFVDQPDALAPALRKTLGL
jgi:hypothetical protein